MIRNKKILNTLIIKLGFILNRLNISVEKNELEWLANDISLEFLAFHEIKCPRILDFLNEIGLNPKILKMEFGLFVEGFREQIDIVSYMANIKGVMENNEKSKTLIEEFKK